MNQELYNKQYQIPINIKNYVKSVLYQHPVGLGIRRAKFILNNDSLSYQAMKGLKHDLDNVNLTSPDGKLSYELSGGKLMKDWVDVTLNSDRDRVKISNDTRQEISNDLGSDLGVSKVQGLNEDHKILKQNAVAVIVNSGNKILLLKRSEKSDWGAGQYALAGGRIDNGETPENAVRREIFEETGLILNSFNERYNLTRDDNSEFIFAVRHTGDDTDVKLNPEHESYGWFDISEIKHLDSVPHLMEYLSLCFKKY